MPAFMYTTEGWQAVHAAILFVVILNLFGLIRIELLVRTNHRQLLGVYRILSVMATHWGEPAAGSRPVVTQAVALIVDQQTVRSTEGGTAP